MNTVVVIASALLQLCTEMLQLSYSFCHTESVMCHECSWVCGSSVDSVKMVFWRTDWWCFPSQLKTELFQQSLVFLKMFKLKTLRAFCFYLGEIFFFFWYFIHGK